MGEKESEKIQGKQCKGERERGGGGMGERAERREGRKDERVSMVPPQKHAAMHTASPGRTGNLVFVLP